MDTILVTGATGNVGSAVVAELGDRGLPVRAFVRDPDRAAAILGPDVELAVGDFADPASIRAALEGIEVVFLACANVPPQVEYEIRVIDAAARAGVRRLVKLSASGPRRARGSPSGTGTPGSRGTWRPRASPGSTSAPATS